MTRTTNARITGVALLLYIAAGIASLALAGRTQAAELLTLITTFCALVLGVTLYAITKEQDPDLAMMGLACRVLEAAPGPGEIFFAVGSTLFCWLLLKGRMIPTALAQLGVLASVLLVVILPVRAAFGGGSTNWASSVGWLMWLPMLVFELALAAWLLTRGVAAPAATARAR
jgi:hypothetical protein